MLTPTKSTEKLGRTAQDLSVLSSAFTDYLPLKVFFETRRSESHDLNEFSLVIEGIDHTVSTPAPSLDVITLNKLFNQILIFLVSDLS
jgi:hypothetical protein